MRRLKEIAKDNEDHQRTLEYKIKEMQASRWHENRNPLVLRLEGLYFILSNYGRSILLPIFWLIAFSTLLAGHYTQWTWDKWERALQCSVNNSLPVLGSSREVLKLCASVDFPEASSWMTASHSVMSVILLFLLVLALRNRFRL